MADPLLAALLVFLPEIGNVADSAPLGLEKCSSYRFEEAETTGVWRSGQLSRLPPFSVYRSFWNSCSSPTPRCGKPKGVIARHDSSPLKLGFGAAASTRLAIRRR